MIDTSIEAWKSIQIGLNKKQTQVLGAIIVNEGATNEQIANYLGVTINTVTPRTGELIAKKKIFRGEKVKTRSNRMAYMYYASLGQLKLL